jgi:hypothetical protein
LIYFLFIKEVRGDGYRRDGVVSLERRFLYAKERKEIKINNNWKKK